MSWATKRRAWIAALALPFAGPARVCGEPTVLECQCGFVCNDTGVREGNANISGTSIDAYFVSVLGYSRAAAQIDREIAAELQAIARSLGLAPTATASQIRAATATRLANATMMLRAQVSPPRCSVSTDAVVAAAARCGSESPGPAGITACSGTCTPDARTCGPDEMATCSAPQRACDGVCTGECALAVAAPCEGKCYGDCEGTCSLRDSLGACAGRCDGDCRGTCIQGGATCSGSCEGVCSTPAPPAGCAEASQTTCAADGADVPCVGQCDGTVLLGTSSLCVAAAQAAVNLAVHCDPSRLVTTWQWSGALVDNEAEQAAFKAWLAELERRTARLSAADRRAALVLRVGSGLKAALGLVEQDIEARLAEDPAIQIAIGVSCALSQLDAVKEALDDIGVTLQDARSDAAAVSMALITE